MKQLFILTIGLFLSIPSLRAQKYTLQSPDKKYSIEVNTQPSVHFSILKNNQVVVPEVAISMTLEDGKILGNGDKVSKKKTSSVNETIRPVVAVKNSVITDQYNQLALKFKKGYSLVFRVYNDAVAYRFETEMGNNIIVSNEQFDLKLPQGTEGWFSYLAGKDNVSDRWMTSYEKVYKKDGLNDYEGKTAIELPILLDLKQNGKLLITESDLRDYPGIYLKKDADNTLKSVLPPKVKENKENNTKDWGWDRTLRPKEVYDYIAETKGTRTFPWRIMALAEKDIDLLNNEIVFKVAEPNQLKNTDWIQPGQVAWDWWNDWNISGVDFKSGINTDTYKYYIDFASENHLPYIIMDDGWYKLGDLTTVNPNLDMQELTRYAASKNVGIILWASWLTLDQQMQEALDLFQSWGIKGIKVDFMDRDDQDVVNFYERTASEAAKRHLMVDFHGSHKPTGLNRAYPNVINYEGVNGLEQSKWGKDATPQMAVEIPYIRMFTGPLDYTPGAMRNQTKNGFSPNYSLPTSQGTRAQQLAMYVIYESPLQMLSDNPTAYKKEKESLDFIKSIPTTWDETIPLSGEMGEFVAIARKKGNEYFAGGMTNWKAREVALDLSFLPEGNWTIEIFEDGVNAHRNANDYRIETKAVTNADKLNIHLAPGGGFAARIYR